MLLVLNMSEFWIYHSSKYARITQGFEYARIYLSNSWVCMIMHYPSYSKPIVLDMVWESHDISVVEWAKIPKFPLLLNGD